jgi:hypothetical protein
VSHFPNNNQKQALSGLKQRQMEGRMKEIVGRTAGAGGKL